MPDHPSHPSVNTSWRGRLVPRGWSWDGLSTARARLGTARARLGTTRARQGTARARLATARARLGGHARFARSFVHFPTSNINEILCTFYKGNPL